MRLAQQPRSAITIVESAIVYPLTLFFLLALVVGAMGVFRYQEMASLSREASRYASVHGTEYAKTAKVTAPTPEDIYKTAVLKKAVGLDPTRLSYSITYNRSNSPSHVKIENGDVKPYTNKVRVVLTYKWIPESILGGITLSSTSESTMSY